jgi:hypothetical protein
MDTDHSDRNREAIVSAEVSSTVTSSVRSCMRRSPVAARCPARAAVVTPPAQAPTRWTSGLFVMRQAAAMASSAVAM